MTRSNLTASDRNSPSHRSEVLFSPAVQKGRTKTFPVFIPKRSNRPRFFGRIKSEITTRTSHGSHSPGSFLATCSCPVSLVTRILSCIALPSARRRASNHLSHITHNYGADTQRVSPQQQTLWLSTTADGSLSEHTDKAQENGHGY